MGATLPRHSAHSKAKVQGAHRRRALCPRSGAIDTFLPFGCGVLVALLLLLPGPVRVREDDVDTGLVDEIGRFLAALEPAAHRRGGEAQKLCQLSDAAGGLTGLVKDQRGHVRAETGRPGTVVPGDLVRR